MRIAVCDDEEKENINLTNLIYDYADENGIDMAVRAFTSGEELLKEEKFDLYFLDYIMPGMNGADVALALREKFGDSLVICFLTSYEKAAASVINNNIAAIGFLSKPCIDKNVFEIFSKLEKRSFFNTIMLKKDGTAFIYYPQDILYAEAMKKVTVIHSLSSSEGFRISFADIENEYLPKNIFSKVHRSYIVNLIHVKTYNKKEITMRNGDVIKISRNVDFDKIIEAYRFDSFAK